MLSIHNCDFDVFDSVTGELTDLRRLDGFDPFDSTDLVETFLSDDDPERPEAEPLVDDTDGQHDVFTFRWILAQLPDGA